MKFILILILMTGVRTFADETTSTQEASPDCAPCTPAPSPNRDGMVNNFSGILRSHDLKEAKLKTNDKSLLDEKDKFDGYYLNVTTTSGFGCNVHKNILTKAGYRSTQQVQALAKALNENRAQITCVYKDADNLSGFSKDLTSINVVKKSAPAR